MKRFCLALTLLPFVAFAAYDFTDLWPDQASIPHYDANQTAGQPNMMSTASYREGVRYMPFLDWQTAPKTTAPANGRPCLILISGGAYSYIADMDKITTWKNTFTALGIQCVVLYYRVPRSADPLPIYQAAWDDGQRAVRMVRSMAAARGLDPDKIGVIGMSAGSHLATLLATSSHTPAYTAVDDLDSTSAHIDVALANAIAYGMSDGLTGTNSGRGIGATLDTIFKFDADTCPMCMTHGGADSYSPLSSSMVWRRLRAMDVTAELHTYPDKEHGAYGLDRHVEFLRKLGWIPSEAAVSPATRWPDDSACAGVSNETYTAGALAWYHPAVHKTASVQILLAGPAAASQEVSDAIVSARRYLNATGITVVTAQIRSGTEVADAQAAVAAVRADAAKYGLNADYIGLMGYRADAATAVAAATTTVADNKVRWVAAISPTTGASDAPLAAITSDTPPTVFIHEELNSTDSAVGSVASWEKQRELWDQGAVHTLAAEDADFISTAAVPGTAAYTYLDRVYDFLSEKKDLAAWTDPEPEDEPEEPVEPEPEYVQMPWFEVQFQNSAFVAGADWIAQSADPAGGTFAPASGVESELVKASADTAYVQYADDKEGEIVYTPSTASPADKSVHVTGRAKVESRTSLPAADANAAAGLCFISGFPYGFAGGSWTKIGVDSFTEGEWVDYDVEFDLASASAPRVRYTVGTSVGNWIALDGTASQVVSVRFEGGSFGNFKGTYEEEVVEPQEADPDTSWMAGSFGVSFHWTAKVVTNNGTMNWEQAVNNFNVEDFADSVESFGAQHVIFTTAHAWQQLPCPCVALDNLITGRTTERDLLKDIIDELTNRNIRVIFYYNHSCNGSDDTDWNAASGYNDITDAASMATYAGRICNIVRELSLRYGDGVSAWWFDSASSVDDSQPWPKNKSANKVAGLGFPWNDLFAAARAGNPHAAVAVNWDVHAVDQHGLATDYLSGETEKIDVYGNYFPFAPADIQDHIWTCMDSTAWFWNGSNLNTASRFSSLDSLKAWKASHRAAGRMATLNLLIDDAGAINPLCVTQLESAKTIGKVWVQGRYDPTTWQAAPSTSNLVLGLTAAHEGNRSEYTDGYHRTPTTVLTDGAVPSSEIVAGAGLTNEEKTQIFEALDGNVLTWNLAQASDVYGLNLYSRSTRSDNNGGTDSSHDAIVVNSIEVLPASESNWVSIGAPAISFGVQDGISGGALAAKLVDGTGAPLATGVTAIRFTQGACENGASLLVEAEVLGCAAAEQPDQPEEPDEPEELPVYTLTIPAKTGLVLDSVTTNSVPVEAAENSYSIVSNTEVTITFTAASGYELDGNGGIVKKTIEANYTFVDADYPAVKAQGGGEDPVDPPPGPQPGELVNGRANMKGWAMKRISTASKVSSEAGFGWSAGDNPKEKVYTGTAQQYESVMVFNEAQVVNTIQLFAPKTEDNSIPQVVNQMPSAFKIYGSNDGSSWTELLSVTGEEDWLSMECRYYTFQNETAYTQYKLAVDSTVNGNAAKLGVYNYFLAVEPDPTTPWTYANGKLTRGDQQIVDVVKGANSIYIQYSNNPNNESLYDLDFTAGIVDGSGNPIDLPFDLKGASGNKFITRIVANPDGAVVSGAYAFENLWYLNEVVFSDAVTRLPTGAFKQCYSLQHLDTAEWALPTIENETFVSCYNLNGDLTFTALTNQTVMSGSRITSVSFPNIQYFGNGSDSMASFGFCPRLTNIVFGAELETVNCGQFLGKIVGPTAVRWNSAPPTFLKGETSIFNDKADYTVTNYLPNDKQAEWEGYAESKGSNFTLPEGDTAGTWTSGKKAYVRWWDGSEEPEEPEVPVYALTIPAKENLTLVSVETNGVEVAAVEGVYSIVSNTEVTVTFAAAGGYELTGSGVVVLTVDGDKTFGDGDYPGVAILEDTATYTWKSTVAEGDWSDPANWTCSTTGTIGYPNYLNGTTGPTAKFASSAIVHLPEDISIKQLQFAKGAEDVRFVGDGETAPSLTYTNLSGVNDIANSLVFDHVVVNSNAGSTYNVTKSGLMFGLENGATFIPKNKFQFTGANQKVIVRNGSTYDSLSTSLEVGGNGSEVLVDDADINVRWNFTFTNADSITDPLSLVMKGDSSTMTCGTAVLNSKVPASGINAVNVVIAPSITRDPTTPYFKHGRVGQSLYGNTNTYSSPGMFFGRDDNTFAKGPIEIGVDAEALATWNVAARETGKSVDYLIVDWKDGGILTNLITLAELDGGNYFYYGADTVNLSAGGYVGTYPTKLYLHLEQSAELSFATPTVAARGTTATVSVGLSAIGPEATSADVYFAYGTDAEALGESVLVKSGAVAGEVLSVALSGLTSETTYYYAFYATNNLLETAEVVTEFTTKPLEQLVLENAKAAASTSAADLHVTLSLVGENATSAAVAVAWGEAADELCDPVLVADAATAGEIVSYSIDGLVANTQYFFEFSATNNLGTVATLASSFKTPDPSVARSAHDFYPTNTTGSVLVPDGYAVTYYAEDAAKPYHVIPVDNCTFAYTSTVTKAGQEYKFFSEADFEANATARIGDTYYLFLSDAVDAAKSGDTIELLKDNNFVAKQMTIAIPLVINGNGHVVKVKDPYVGENGFINTNCTIDVRNVFTVKADVELYDMTVMGGGHEKTYDIGSKYNDPSSAVVVTKDGVLKMENVTLTRSNGGLVTETGARVLINKCQIVRNCRFCGGGMYNLGTVVMNNSSLSENRSTGYYNLSANKYGGGGAAENQGSMYINNCVICNNVSGEYGGAINNFSQTNDIKLYLINSTVAGNLTTASGGATRAGGIALRIGHVGGASKFCAVNNIICNNWHYNMTSHILTQSDVRVGERYKATTEVTENFIVYNAIGEYSEAKSGLANTTMENNVTVVPANDDVFLQYYSSQRVYQWDAWTQCEVNTGSLRSAPDDPNALYVPILPDGAAVVDTTGVTTYFDYSDWKNGDVKMSYAALDEVMQTIGSLAPAETDDLVTTFYETDIVPNTIARTIGIMGADGWTTDDAKTYKLRLLEEPKNGSVHNITSYGTDYRVGSEVTVTATPDAACSFLGWYYADDTLASPDAAFTVVMDRNIELKAKFSPPSPTHTFLNIQCEQTEGDHGLFPLTVTTNWIGKVFDDICPSGIVTEDVEETIESRLNARDEANGLNHVWMNYVLGAMMPGDPNGRIWIRADQTRDETTLRFRMQELAPTKDCGFTVKYRLNKKPAGKETYSRGSYAESGSFEDKVTLSDLEHRVIDLIFIPTNSQTSAEYVTTVNTAGVVKVDSMKKIEILASPWAGFSPTNNPAVKASEFVKASSLTTNDVLYVYDQAESNYLAWAVQADGTWRAVRTFQIENGVVIAERQADALRTNAIPRGAGAWLERKDPTKPIYLYGQVDETSVVTPLVAGWNLIGSPAIANFDVTELPVPAPERQGENGDHVIVPTDAAPINLTYKDDSWGYTTNIVRVIGDKTFIQPTRVNSDIVVPVGCGFWYIGAGEGAVEW